MEVGVGERAIIFRIVQHAGLPVAVLLYPWVELFRRVEDAELGTGGVFFR